MYTLIN